MNDYSTYIMITYGVSGFALLVLGLMSYRRMKSTEREAKNLRRRRKERS